MDLDTDRTNGSFKYILILAQSSLVYRRFTESNRSQGTDFQDLDQLLTKTTVVRKEDLIRGNHGRDQQLGPSLPEQVTMRL